MKGSAILIIFFMLMQLGRQAHAYEEGPAWVTVIEAGKVLFYEHLDDARKNRAARYPHLNNLDLAGKYIRFDTVISEGHCVPAKCAAPQTYGKRKVLACPLRYFTPAGRRLVFLSYGIHPLEGRSGAKDEDRRGVFAVVDAKTGTIKTVIPSEYVIHGAGRGGMVMEPQLGLAEGYAFYERKGSLVAFGLDTGRELWEAHEQFGWSTALLSTWMAGNALIVRTKEGLARLDPETGKCIWRTDKVQNMITVVELGPDRRLYIVSYDAP